jgi:long-chain acyl-CoA synthetase
MGRTLRDLINHSFIHYADRVAVRILQQTDGDRAGDLTYQPLTYDELKDRRDRLAAGLAGIGLHKGQRVGLLMDGGLEPLLVFLATDLIGLSAVPLCNKAAAEILIHNVNHSGIQVLVVDPKGYEIFQRIYSFLDHPPRLVLTEERQEDALAWDDLLEVANPPEVELSPEDESKVLYTSGSSGMPKGVIQSHANIVANVKEVWDVISRREPLRMFKSVPDYHSMGVLNIYYPLAKGWVLDLARSPDRVLNDIRYSAPEGFLTVPLILDKVYGNVRKEMAVGGFKSNIVTRSVQARRNISRGQAGVGDRLIDATVGRKVIGAIKEKLAGRVGGNLELLIIGSAKADPEALDFFQDVLDIATFEGYGTTECAPMIAANHLGGRKVGTVGRPLIEVKMISAAGEEVGYGNPATGLYRSHGDIVGELWVHGPNVMKGYLNDPDQTGRVLVEDREGKIWYRTGDLFSIDSEGFLTFKGRMGRQFKLKNGEFINPELLERVFSRVALTEHVLIYGDHTRDFYLVLATVDLEEAKKQVGIAGLPVDDEAALRCDERLAQRIRQLMLEEADAAGLPTHERPQKIVLLPEPLSEEAGTLTRGLKKIVPGAVVEQYRELIDAV